MFQKVATEAAERVTRGFPLKQISRTGTVIDICNLLALSHGELGEDFCWFKSYKVTSTSLFPGSPGSTWPFLLCFTNNDSD